MNFRVWKRLSTFKTVTSRIHLYSEWWRQDLALTRDNDVTTGLMMEWMASWLHFKQWCHSDVATAFIIQTNDITASLSIRLTNDVTTSVSFRTMTSRFPALLTDDVTISNTPYQWCQDLPLHQNNDFMTSHTSHTLLPNDITSLQTPNQWRHDPPNSQPMK